MKVKTFTGTSRAKVDKAINAWLRKTGVQVHRTDVAFKRLREKGADVVSGKTTRRVGLAVAITVWYDAAFAHPRPDTWVFGGGPV